MPIEARHRPGRPKTIPRGNATTVYLNADRVDDFRKLCEEYKITVSEGLRQLIDAELERNEKGFSTTNSKNKDSKNNAAANNNVKNNNNNNNNNNNKQSNPIGINYNMANNIVQSLHSNLEKPAAEPLDMYLKNGDITLDLWLNKAKKENDLTIVLKKQNLATIIQRAYSMRCYNMKTGRWQM